MDMSAMKVSIEYRMRPKMSRSAGNDSVTEGLMQTTLGNTAPGGRVRYGNKGTGY